MVQDPDFMKKLEDYMNKFKPEVAYFLSIDGHREDASDLGWVFGNLSDDAAGKTIVWRESNT